MNSISPRQRVALIAGTATAILAVGAAVVALFASRVAAQRWVEHTYQVLRASDRMVADLVDAETGQRGYLLTGDQMYLPPYRRGLGDRDSVAARLRALVADNPGQLERIDTLDVWAADKSAEMARTIKLRQREGPAAAAALVATGRGRELMDSVRRIAGDIRRSELRLLAERQARADGLVNWVFLVAGAGTLAGVCLTLFQGGLLARALEQQEALTRELADRAQVLEDTAGELEMSNEELQGSNEQLQHTIEQLQTTTEELEASNEELVSANDELMAINHELDRSRAELEARQAELSRSEARFRSLVDASAQAVWWTDAEGRITGPLPAWEAFVGLSTADLQGRGWLQSIYEEDRGRTEEQWRRAVTTRTMYQITHRVRRHDGQYRYMSARAVPVPGPDGRPIEWIGAHIDVTEQELGAAALRQSEERFRTLAEHLPVSLFTCRPDGRTDYVNPAWCTLTGVGPSQALAHGWAATVHPADQPRVTERWKAALAGDPVELHYRHVRPDGSVRHVRTTAQAVRNEAGDVAAVLGTGIDLTERFEQEEQLRHAQRMQAVGRLAGGMAHELNNMLTASIGFGVYALRNLPADHPAVGDIAQSLKAQERAARITSQVLSFSRRQMLAPSRFELKEAVQDLVPLLQQSLEPGQSIQLALADELGDVFVDRTRLDQALLNLVLNARDAMPDGGTLTLRTRRAVLRPGGLAGPEGERLRPGPYLAVSVQDTGTGMDPETRRRALEPFFTTKPVGQGTGLGLSMAYGFARQSEGTLIIDSEPGHGTTVSLYLPLAPPEQEVDLSTAGSADGRPESPSGEHILIVDDEPSVRSAMRRALEDQGYQVIEAESGAEAIVRLGEAPRGVHLVVCDLLMPSMSGRVLGTTLRERWPALPVLYVSGFPDAEGDEGMMPAGAPFLKKPFSPETLTARVRAMLHGHG